MGAKGKLVSLDDILQVESELAQRSEESSQRVVEKVQSKTEPGKKKLDKAKKTKIWKQSRRCGTCREYGHTKNDPI